MTCKECNAARECGNYGRLFDSLKCVYCAARLIQRIGKLRIGAEQCVVMRRKALADSVAVGLDEAMIRKLAKGPVALESEVVKERKKR